MPYRRYKYIRGKRYRRGGYRGRPAFSRGSWYVKTLKGIARNLNVETKHFVKESTVSTADFNGVIQTLNEIPQGDTSLTRDGDSLKMTKLRLRVTAKTTASTDSLCRIIVFTDKQNTMATVADFWDHAGDGFAPYAAKNPLTRFNTNVHYDSGLLQLINGTAKEQFNKDLIINIPAKQSHVNFELGSTTILNNALKIFLISNINTNEPVFAYFSEVSYVDN